MESDDSIIARLYDCVVPYTPPECGPQVPLTKEMIYEAMRKIEEAPFMEPDYSPFFTRLPPQRTEDGQDSTAP